MTCDALAVLRKISLDNFVYVLLGNQPFGRCKEMRKIKAGIDVKQKSGEFAALNWCKEHVQETNVKNINIELHIHKDGVVGDAIPPYACISIHLHKASYECSHLL